MTCVPNRTRPRTAVAAPSFRRQLYRPWFANRRSLTGSERLRGRSGAVSDIASRKRYLCNHKHNCGDLLILQHHLDGFRNRKKRTGSDGRVAAAADPQSPREKSRTAHHQICDSTAGSEGRSAGSESCKHDIRSSSPIYLFSFAHSLARHTAHAPHLSFKMCACIQINYRSYKSCLKVALLREEGVACTHIPSLNSHDNTLVP